MSGTRPSRTVRIRVSYETEIEVYDGEVIEEAFNTFSPGSLPEIDGTLKVEIISDANQHG